MMLLQVLENNTSQMIMLVKFSTSFKILTLFIQMLSTTGQKKAGSLQMTGSDRNKFIIAKKA
jgi:hypothetical protein